MKKISIKKPFYDMKSGGSGFDITAYINELANT
jgi:hypothetical protein